MIVGRTYLLAGEPVVIVTQWRLGHGKVKPRNVTIQRADGTRDVRPFRGLRATSQIGTAGVHGDRREAVMPAPAAP